VHEGASLDRTAAAAAAAVEAHVSTTTMTMGTTVDAEQRGVLVTASIRATVPHNEQDPATMTTTTTIDRGTIDSDHQDTLLPITGNNGKIPIHLPRTNHDEDQQGTLPVTRNSKTTSTHRTPKHDANAHPQPTIHLHSRDQLEQPLTPKQTADLPRNPNTGNPQPTTTSVTSAQISESRPSQTSKAVAHLLQFLQRARDPCVQPNLDRRMYRRMHRAVLRPHIASLAT